ncbi:MAG: DinB family protein [Pleurocapsa minor GSE-CHR-MK-17-07R]|nr:DinB family protein [Pleurocapsa minor GSE-CHR-MK 17-07R]
MPAAERQQYIATLREFPARLTMRLYGLTDAQLDQRTAPSEWSARQIVHHCADSHMSANFRFRLPLHSENPMVPTYDQDAWAKQPDYALPLAPSLEILRGLHVRFVALLEALTEADWARPVSHPEWGQVTVEEIARRYANHCDNHMRQIDGIGVMHGW